MTFRNRDRYGLKPSPARSQLLAISYFPKCQSPCVHEALSTKLLRITPVVWPPLEKLIEASIQIPTKFRNFRPTEMVRDMRGMRGKSCGLVDICIGWRPKGVGTVLAGNSPLLRTCPSLRLRR